VIEAATRPLEDLRRRLLPLALAGDRRNCLREAVAVIEQGVPLADFVLEVLAPIQVEVGNAWARGEIQHQQEKLATEIAEILLTIASGRTQRTATGLKLVVCVADGEHHNLPARMVAELLRAEGHAVTFLGMPTPRAELGRLMAMVEPDAVVISCSLSMNLPGVVGLAGVAHNVGLPVIVGGAAFSGSPSRAPTVGADGYARTVNDVGELGQVRADRLASGPAGERATEWSALVPMRRQIAVESTEQLIWFSSPLIPRPLRAPGALIKPFSDLLRFVEAATLVDDHVLIDYARWLTGHHARTLRADPDFTVAMLTTLRDQLESSAPVAASAVDAAVCTLASSAA
jgi:methanogenic corrinoid protein MtbC1